MRNCVIFLGVVTIHGIGDVSLLLDALSLNLAIISSCNSNAVRLELLIGYWKQSSKCGENGAKKNSSI